MGRWLRGIVSEETVSERYRMYFQDVSLFLLELENVRRKVESGEWDRYSLEMEGTKVYDSSGRERNVEELREGMELLVAYTSIQETDPGQIRPQWVEVIGEP